MTGWFLCVVQAHYSIPGELVEGGQLLAIYIDPAITGPVGVTPVGTSSPGCNGPLAVSAKAEPTKGNRDFALTCLNAPANGNGALLFSSAALTTPVALLGIQVFVDPNAPMFLAFGVKADAQGESRVPLPVPTAAALASSIAAQFVFVGPTAPAPCPPLGLSSSYAVVITIQ